MGHLPWPGFAAHVLALAMECRGVQPALAPRAERMAAGLLQVYIVEMSGNLLRGMVLGGSWALGRAGKTNLLLGQPLALPPDCLGPGTGTFQSGTRS
ncbi:MAG TPA: hypothetical protein VHM70_22590 [Polyangiaceae bacterium]|nr:hypothetical protein [Polyangiaceae bacterium]